jgi:hypothetical protein
MGRVRRFVWSCQSASRYRKLEQKQVFFITEPHHHKLLQSRNEPSAFRSEIIEAPNGFAGGPVIQNSDVKFKAMPIKEWEPWLLYETGEATLHYQIDKIQSQVVVESPSTPFERFVSLVGPVKNFLYHVAG